MDEAEGGQRQEDRAPPAVSTEGPLRPGNVKVIRCSIGNPCFLADLRLTAPIRSRLSTDSVHPLDTLRLAEDAIAFGGLCAQQQPWNGVGVRTIVARLDFADGFAPVIGFQGGTGIVLANALASVVD